MPSTRGRTSPAPILFASGNHGKLAEIRKLLGESHDVVGLDGLGDFQPPEETGSTFEANAKIKAETASQVFPGLCIADDSGLEVDALNGAPGVYSARFAGPEATDAENVRCLLERLKEVRGKARSGRFRCVVAVAQAGRTLETFHGKVEGIVVPTPKGSSGFGYDPVFVPEGFCQTFAELGSEIKNRLSHRALAVEKLRNWLAEQSPPER